MPENTNFNWYAVHTYSGYENKVMDSLKKVVENRNLQDQIDRIEVPVEEVIQIKGGKRDIKPRKVFPGYVLIHMTMNNSLWYIVRNTRGCTGFVGQQSPDNDPVPLSQEEADAMLSAGGTRIVNLDFEVGCKVVILSGSSFENFTGTIVEIDEENQKLKVQVPLFARDTIVEVDYENARKIMEDEKKPTNPQGAPQN